MLFSVASQVRGIDLGTGDLSELALGFATYGGDHMSHYGVNAGVPKTLVSELIRWAADTLFARRRPWPPRSARCSTRRSAPSCCGRAPDGAIAQHTEALVGPYELHDFFLYHFLRFGFGPRRIARMALHAFDGRYALAEIRRWLLRVPAAVLREPVQARLRARLAEGRLRRLAVAARRLAHAGDASVAAWIAEAETIPHADRSSDAARDAGPGRGSGAWVVAAAWGRPHSRGRR